MVLHRHHETSPPRLKVHLGGQVGVLPPATSFCLALFSLPFFFYGFKMIATGSRHFSGAGNMFPAKALVSIFGGLFTCALAASILFGALRSLANRLRCQGLDTAHPFSRALRDYPWDSQGQKYSPWPKVLGFMGILILFSLFMIFLTIWIESLGTLALKYRITVWIFNVSLLGAWAAWGRLVLRALKFPGGRLAYGTFPLPVRGPVEFLYRPGRPLRDLRELKATLQCVREFQERPPGPGKKQQRLVHEQIYAIEIGLDPGRWAREGDWILPFELPEGLQPSSLSGGNTVFWRLSLQASSPAGRMEEDYLVPIYAGK